MKWSQGKLSCKRPGTSACASGQGLGSFYLKQNVILSLVALDSPGQRTTTGSVSHCLQSCRLVAGGFYHFLTQNQF